MINKCPGCDNDGILDSIPISDKEVYEIDSSQKSRIKLESGGNNNNDNNNDNIEQTSSSIWIWFSIPTDVDNVVVTWWKSNQAVNEPVLKIFQIAKPIGSSSKYANLEILYDLKK